MDDPPNEPLATTERTFTIIQYLQNSGKASVSQIADDLDLAKSTVHRHLATLHGLRYVSRNGQEYQLGLRFTRLGYAAQTQENAFRKAEKQVREISGQTSERAQFIVEDHGLGIYLYMDRGEQAIDTGMRIGQQIHLHYSASGKAILANYPRERVDEIVDRWGLPKQTANTITDRETLKEELDQIEDRGVAFNHEEHIDGLTAVAVPVENDDVVFGALSVAGPTGRMQSDRIEETIPELLLGSANALELELVHGQRNSANTFVVE
jgi:DNA-binding IclR family transcriptional regulator